VSLGRNHKGRMAVDVLVFMAVCKLTPLGDPAPNAPIWFAVVEMIRLGVDQDWLHKATKEISDSPALIAHGLAPSA